MIVYFSSSSKAIYSSSSSTSDQQPTQQQQQQQQEEAAFPALAIAPLPATVLKVVLFASSAWFRLPLPPAGCSVAWLRQQVAAKLAGTGTTWDTLRLVYGGRVLTADVAGQRLVLLPGVRVAHVLTRLEGG
ncbi:hypothetical protein OEZ85_005682 [Tetradesmus obliquus]|uniref:Ubiquitin-like domain-containing protein n=1 Tax=Tetradesmus obliquus TaxID=3088 RepID=A0ABY8UE45_TETOB|nr:hypothetical protein OEZ85_005682 [Tetradesmus obliquus]